MKMNKNCWQFISLALSGAALLHALRVLLLDVRAANCIYYETVSEPFCSRTGNILISAAGALLAVLCTLPWRKEWCGRMKTAENILRPLLLLWLIPCSSFPGIFFAVLLISMAVFRGVKQFDRPIPELPHKYGMMFSIAGWIALTAWGYYLQMHAWDTHYFIWGDWNQYAEHYHLLMSGNARFSQWFSGAGHWNPAVNLIMYGALTLWNAPDMIFIINSLCIASIIPLGYWLSRKCGAGVWAGLIYLPLAVLNPVLSNQHLSLFYGFHPIVFFVPLLMGFFIAGEYKCRWLMVLLFIFSLFIQETVCVFWAGYAIYLFCRKKWKTAIILFSGMAGFFLFCSHVAIPAAHDAESYSQMFHYSQLGNTLTEVLISPFTRPGAFWGTLFERSSYCFALALFVPLFFGVIFKPLMLLTLAPIFAGVILQSSPDVKTVALQYGLECTVFSMIIMTLSMKQLPENLRRASLAAVLTATCLLGWMFSMIPGNKGLSKPFFERKSGLKLINFLDEAAGNSSRIIATGRIRGQFQFMRPTAGIRSGYRSGDAIILDLHDDIVDNASEVFELQRRLAFDKRAVPVTYAIWDNHTIVVFKILDQEVPCPPIPWLRHVPEKLFEHAGQLVHRNSDKYELRYALINGNNIYRFLLKKTVECDIEFQITQVDRQRNRKTAVVLFGNGLFPACTAAPGTMFEFAIPGEAADIQAYIREKNPAGQKTAQP